MSSRVRASVFARVLLLVILAATGAGCSSVREITPWLRTASWNTEEIDGAPYTEQLVRGRWIRVASDDEARAIRGGSLVVYRSHGYMLTNARGDGATLDCTDTFRVLPGEVGFACIDVGHAFVDEKDDLAIGLKLFDALGRKTVDVKLVLEAGALRRSYFPHFIGFAEDGAPLVSAHVSAADETFSEGQEKDCALFALREGGIERIGFLTTAAWADCDQPSFWRQGYVVNEGATI